MSLSVKQTIERKNSGFTVIELMVVLVVVGVLVGLAAPNFREWVSNNKSVAVREDLLATLMYARAEAVKLSKPVSVCQSSNGTSCDASAGNWRQGMLVYQDTYTGSLADNNTTLVAANILRVVQAYPASVSIGAQRSATNVRFIRFNSSGMSSFPVDTVFTTAVEGCSGKRKNQITVKLSGLTSVVAQDCP